MIADGSIMPFPALNRVLSVCSGGTTLSFACCSVRFVLRLFSSVEGKSAYAEGN